QQDSAVKSLETIIIPFLRKSFAADFDIVGNDHMTLLVMKLDEECYTDFSKYFGDQSSFDSFTIPKEIYAAGDSAKSEFVSGFLDAAGFYNAGGWLPRSGKKNYGRMRAYFQIVRNWELPVQICNFLKEEFGLPIHTIDWGHPNIRDSNMRDYYNSNPLSWSREHQLKFFPEYYQGFTIRIKHKENMFNELVSHNIDAIFDKRDDCTPPTSISLNKVKAYHPGESDVRIPESTRLHCDAFWQVCHNMGCMYTREAINQSANPKYYLLTGKDEGISINSTQIAYDRKRKSITKQIKKKNEGKKQTKTTKAEKKRRTNPEQKLYDLISKWLEKYLSEKFKEKVLVQDTSAFYLDKFILQNNLVEEFDFCNKYKIKPDIVGFLMDSKELVFVEVKVGALSLHDVGQLLGYSLVGLPKLSILISPEPTSINLAKILEANPHLLDYGKDRMVLGTWDGEKGVLEGD
ncbi:MAG: hypothetical protein ACTSQE_17095, partial [Candidatus Heimdallarchaeaceae archaeon]